MINYQKNVLSNGLSVIVHEDPSSPLCAVNILYKVGSRDENPKKTGFAHLFEHLMFGGSKNAPDFDGSLQMAGGDNNAFTNSDITNYYEVLPVTNLETALWLESDRMRNLVINSDSLEVQRKVVLEEFSETCLNPPFGMKWHHLNGMAYEKHPYRWPTIGLVPEHIEEAELTDVAEFFQSWYVPNNATICLSGGISIEKGFRLVEKWFGDIPSRDLPERLYIREERQVKRKEMHVKEVSPIDSFTLAFHCSERLHEDYYSTDVLTDVFSGGRTARFFSNLVEKKRVFTNLDAYISGTIDPGLLIIEGKPVPGTSMEDAEKEIWSEINKIKNAELKNEELETQKNRIINNLKFSEVSILNKAMSLSYYDAIDRLDLVNDEMLQYEKVSVDSIQRIAEKILRQENCSSLYYHKKS